MKIKGVNLGNWLVLEKWMSPALFEGTAAEDEYYLRRQLTREVYEARIAIHRWEYITERDFVTIKSMGMEAVRIPVPYFIFGDREPFIGCVKELDKAFNWAEKYGLKILIDLHTAPMGQNGFDNGGICGVCKWSKCREEVEFVLSVLERLASRYGTRRGLWGIEVLNEPITQKAWELMEVPNRYPAADRDMAEADGCRQDLDSYLAHIRENVEKDIEEMQKYFPVICGEWCLFNSLVCGCHTKGGQSILNGVEGSAKEQIGWDSWDFGRCVDFGWFPAGR